MDDVLIIVLTLAFTILAAVNNSKKKKQPVEGKQPDFWKVLFPEAETREGQFPEELREIATPIKPVPPRPKQVRRNEPAGNFGTEGVRNENVIRISEAKTREMTETGMVEESISEDFTLRKAVIYSEILHPKYF